jgi:RNA polymerase sigma factor (sigma-70 family)
MTVPRSDSPLRIRAVADDSGGETDAAIIARSKQEPSAFAELFDRHADCVHRFAARRLGAQLADDMLSETFSIAFEHRDRYDLSRADARPWLLGILTNVTRRHRQSEARRWRAMANADHAPVTEPMAERVAAQVTARARRADLARALAGMSRRNRDVLLLIAWADLDYAETAAALGVPLGTVRSRMNRARRTLRKALGDLDPTEADGEKNDG